jgi:hypothetical protein
MKVSKWGYLHIPLVGSDDKIPPIVLKKSGLQQS